MASLHDSLYDAAKPLISWLKEHGTPHTQIIVKDDHVKVTQDVMGLPIGHNTRSNHRNEINAENLEDKYLECVASRGEVEHRR